MHKDPNALLPKPASRGHVPPGSQVTVTIGRNIGDTPMHRLYWEGFQDTVASAVRDLLRPTLTFGPFTGDGEWDGVTETSSVLIAVTSYPASVDAVEARLAGIAADYDQDAIAWSFGPNLLATP